MIAGYVSLDRCDSLTLEDVDLMGDALDSWEAADRRLHKKAEESRT